MDLVRARSLNVAIDRQFIGYRMKPFEVVVDADRVRRFSEAIGAPTDTLPPGVAAPTFLKVVEGEGNSSRRLLEVLGVDLKRVLHAEQEFEFGRPVRAGDRLTVERTVSDIYDRKEGSLEFVIVDSTIRSESGQWVGRSLQSLLIRNPRTATPDAQSSGGHITMTPLLRDQTAGSVMAKAVYGPFDREQLRRYAEASGDMNPLHLDPKFARQAHFDDVIVHGMLGMALLGRLVTEHLPALRITRLRTRFRGVIELGQSIACETALERLSPETADVELTGRNPAGVVVLEGSATLELQVDN